MKVLITARHFLIDDRPQRLFDEAGIEIKPSPYGGEIDDGEITNDEMIAYLSDVDGIIRGNARISKEAIESSPKLKVISVRGVGYDNIDLEAAAKRGIKVTIVPGGADKAVAEYTIALCLAISRGIVQAHNSVQHGMWRALLGTQLYGKVLGIIGLGRIGKAVAEYAVNGFDMEVLAFSRSQDQEFSARHGIKYVDLELLLKSSDFVSIHLPLTPQTEGMVGHRQFEMMKDSAYLVNTARGAILDESALCDALRRRSIAGAALDVFADEPLGESQLRDLDNVLLSPHMAGYTYESKVQANMQAARNALDVLTGHEPTEGVSVS